MASAEELSRLRVEAQRAMRLSQRKRSRILRTTGAEQLGRYEPRIVPPSKIAGYTAKQLESLISQSEQFRSRSVQFKPLANNRVVPASVWRRFDRAQKTRQRQQREAYESIKDVEIPTLGQTIGERRDMVSPPRARQLESNMSFERDLRPPESVYTERSMRKLIRTLEKANSGSEQRRIRRQAMRSLDQMFPYFGDGAGDIEQSIRDLSDDQFFALWSVRDFALDVTAYYESMKALQSDVISASKQSAVEGIAGDYRTELRGLISDVQQIPGNGRRF